MTPGLKPGLKRERRFEFRFDEPADCCIACGRRFAILVDPTRALDEREDWKDLKKNRPHAGSYMVKADDIESMYFYKRPWIWACFYRAIVHRQHIDHVDIAGITQTMGRDDSCYWRDPPHLPRDPQIARRGSYKIIPQASSCTPFWTADVLHPENNHTAPLEQIGYLVHAHCWILVERIIGRNLNNTNLKLFLVAVERFWAENTQLWGRYLFKRVRYEPDSDRNSDTESDDGTSETESESSKECDWEYRDRHKLPMWENPTIVPKIREIIKQATQSQPKSRLHRATLSLVSDVPLDIAIQIVEYLKLASIKDVRNMLTAFAWRLPDSYWRSRCKMDLIFEYADLHKTHCVVDWQIVGLATEELLEDPEWERNTGLGTRRWIFRQLEQIKTIFLDLVEHEKVYSGCLLGPARRKYPLRKRLL